MPLPTWAVEGAVYDIADFTSFGLDICGWCGDSFGQKHAALWMKTEGSPWIAEDLGTLDGYDESVAVGAGLVGKEGDYIVTMIRNVAKDG